jgi:magnesium transporter
MDTENKVNSETIQGLIDGKELFKLKTMLMDVIPLDIIELIRPLEVGDRALVFRLLNKETAAEVFSHLEHEEQEELLAQFGMVKIKEIIEEMDPDDITDLFDELPDEMVKRLIRLLPAGDRMVVNRLLNYPEDSAGRLMTPEFIELDKDSTAEKSIKKIRAIGLNKETIYYSYVIDKKGFLIGIVSLKDLLLATPSTKTEDIMTTNFVYVNTTDDQEEVARVLTKYDLNALPVVDKDKKLVGIVTVDDVVDVIHEEATEDFHKMAGIEAHDNAYFNTNFFTQGRRRVIWLVILLVASFLSSIVLKNYSQILQAIIPLAFFIPMLTGTCGNTGMQSATLIIRGLATGEIIIKDFLKLFFREIFMGGFLGVILGAFSFLRARFIDSDPFIGIVVGIAVFSSVLAANIIGTVLPLILKKIRIDPAISAGPFISTIVDVTTLLIYFEIARAIFHIKT